MMNRVEMNEELMEQVNGGMRQKSAVNPYSPNAIGFPKDFTMGEKTESDNN